MTDIKQHYVAGYLFSDKSDFVVNPSPPLLYKDYNGKMVEFKPSKKVAELYSANEAVKTLLKSDPRVLMIIKNRPEALKGKILPIGGKLEAGETALAAMEREAKEEANVVDVNWQYFCLYNAPWGRIHFFRAFSTEKLLASKTLTDEKLITYNIEALLRPQARSIMGSSVWPTLMLALTADQFELPVFLEVKD